MNVNFTYAGIFLLLAYAIVFYWIFWSAGSEESGKYRNTFSDRAKLNLIGVALIVGAFTLPGLVTPTILFVLAIGWVCWGSYQQHVQMVVEEFDPIFESRLYRSNFLSLAGLAFMFLGKTMGVLNAT